jgi:hypothetical protein
MSNAEPLALPAPQSEFGAAVPGASGRLICLDIFRGLAVTGMILVDNPGSDEKVYWPIAHAEWSCRPWRIGPANLPGHLSRARGDRHDSGG